METGELVVRIFRHIEEAKTITDLKEIGEDVAISNNLITESKYPRIKFDISSEEIKSLIVSGKIHREGLTFSENFVPVTSVEKLLYALVWKQGDLGKIRNIIQGINGVENNSDSVVFYYFGKYLVDKSNPIIDRNVIGAFKCYIYGVEHINISPVSKTDSNDIKRYFEWISTVAGKFINKEDCIYEIDKILFALCKTINKTIKLKSQQIFNFPICPETLNFICTNYSVYDNCGSQRQIA